MRTRELKQALKIELRHTGTQDCYVLARNHFNEKVFRKFPFAAIINTDNWPGKGIHWTAVYTDRRKKAVFFDSLGKHPSHYNININPYQWNDRPLQGNSALCGEYTVLFIKYIARGTSLNQFRRLFSSNKDRNDRLVRRYFNHHLPTVTNISTEEVDQTCVTNCNHG